MTSLAEYFQAFHVYAYENALTASARALYYTILGEFNAAYWKRTELSKSVRDVRALGGFKGESTVQKAKTELCTENIIKISKSKHGDVYQLVEPAQWRKNAALKKTSPDSEQLVNTLCTVSKQQANTSESSNLHVRDKDGKDEKTSEKNKNARAREELDEEVRHAWIQANGEEPAGGDRADLLERVKRFGAKVVVEAITACRQGRTYGDRISIRYLDSKLLKGGLKSEPIQRRDYSSYDFDFTDELPPND